MITRRQLIANNVIDTYGSECLDVKENSHDNTLRNNGLSVRRERRLSKDRLPCKFLSDIPASEPTVEVIAWHRCAEVEALRDRAAQRSKSGVRLGVLDAFGDGVEAKPAS